MRRSVVRPRYFVGRNGDRGGASGGTAALSWSAPSGLSDGNSVMVSTDGTYNFGTKSAAAPIIWERFTGMTPGTTLQSNNANWVTDTNGALISDADSHSGTTCATNDLTRGGFDTNWQEFTACDEVYLSYWMKVANVEGDETGGGSVLKFMRINSTAAAGGGGSYNGVGAHALTSHSPNTLSGGLIGNGYIAFTSDVFSGPIDYVDAPANSWERVEMYVKLSTAGVSDGKLDCGFVGRTYYENTVMNRVTGQTYQLNSVRLGLMHANFTAGALELYNDDIYVDNTRMRVEIGNNATFANCTVREPQPATAWSTNSITVTANLIGLSGNKWLFVIGSNGSVIGSVALQ